MNKHKSRMIGGLTMSLVLMFYLMLAVIIGHVSENIGHPFLLGFGWPMALVNIYILGWMLEILFGPGADT